ncbi:MAG: Molybdenum transport system permease protein ModB, partial [Frankiales bacterium]|nr:Molybdenum transport system permease protein ModB [Frankiales bacterium]
MKADLTARVGSFTVRARLRAEPGEVLALVGPNGAGKSTLLRALGGLLPAEGRLEVGGRELLGLPPESRSVGWVPQAGLLFPHLSALDNAAYALRASGVRRREARATARELLAQLGVADLADRR